MNYLTHDELQHLEHANKVLREHLELVNEVTNKSESILNTYVPILKGYVEAIHDIQIYFTNTVSHILQSTRELKVMTSSNQEIHNYISAVTKLDAVLNDTLIQKITKLVQPVSEDKK